MVQRKVITNNGAKNIRGKTVEAVLFASSWNNNIYTLVVDGVTETSIQDLTPSSLVTDEQLIELQTADITDGGQTKNTIILRANGNVPTTDIPICIYLRGESK